MVALLFPWLPHGASQAIKARWSRQLLGAFGVRLANSGEAPAAGLLVANHVSWLDIFAINAFAPAAFVAKDDIRSWPLIGWLTSGAGTLFIERGSRAAAQRAREGIVTSLRAGRRVAIFPEGTTSFGDGVLPFHGALLQSALDAGTPVMPIVLRYVDGDGRPTTAAAYVGDTSLWQCLRAIATASGLSARVAFLPAIPPVGDRRHLAAHAHRAIAHALGTTPSPTVPPDGHTAAGIPGDPQGAPLSGCHPTDSPSPAPADPATA